MAILLALLLSRTIRGQAAKVGDEQPRLLAAECWREPAQIRAAAGAEIDDRAGTRDASGFRAAAGHRCSCAQQADQLSGGTNVLVLRTLAAAYAEAGQFGKAIETAQAAIQLGQSQGDDSLATELQQEIALYELGLPYREMAK